MKKVTEKKEKKKKKKEDKSFSFFLYTTATHRCVFDYVTENDQLPAEVC